MLKCDPRLLPEWLSVVSISVTCWQTLCVPVVSRFPENAWDVHVLLVGQIVHQSPCQVSFPYSVACSVEIATLGIDDRRQYWVVAAVISQT
jgi:hypothetical protein